MSVPFLFLFLIFTATLILVGKKMVYRIKLIDAYQTMKHSVTSKFLFYDDLVRILSLRV